ncbi:MAG: phosphatase PAP2 family protein [bacterium]
MRNHAPDQHQNKKYLIILLLLFCTLISTNLLFAQASEPNKENRVESPHSADTSQVDKSKEKVLAPSLSRFVFEIEQVFTSKINLVYLGIGTGLSLIIWPHDDEISEDLKDDNLKEFELEAPSKLGSFFTITGASAFTYLLGRTIKKPYLANTSLYLFEAYLTTQFITYITKLSVQRTRPNGSDNLSFPSGHSSGMFVVASVLDKRYGYKVGIPSYLVAGFVGISRIKLQKHFPTDVIAGAALGIIIGRSFIPSKKKNNSFAISPAFYFNYTGINCQIHF